jgi:hypothetical protein
MLEIGCSWLKFGGKWAVDDTFFKFKFLTFSLILMKEMMLEFYEKLFNSMKTQKVKSILDLYSLSRDLIEKDLKPIYGEVDASYLKEHVPFLIGCLDGAKMLTYKEESGYIFPKPSISKLKKTVKELDEAPGVIRELDRILKENK